MTGRYEAVIGLETHAQLLTRSKMFCGCAVVHGAAPNQQTCPICLGFPGVLPVVNRRAIVLGLRTAKALTCQINPVSRFARKHYFYPDMPKNYQISQYEAPLAGEGALEIETGGVARHVGIQRVHLEEDVGKLLHEGGVFETATASGIDFNRAGVPLMEIVTHPDLRSPAEAVAYLSELRAILRYLEACDGNMELGSLRCDANVSLRPAGSTTLGTKVEIKNMNSFRHVRAALEHEMARQAQALDAGERIVQETRLWNADRGITLSMRSKEFAHDYRYFPDPDLVPVAPDADLLAEAAADFPELPRARRQRLEQTHGLPAHDADLLTQDRALADYYEEALGHHANARAMANWIISELLRELGGDGSRATDFPIRPSHLARLVGLIDDGTISGKLAKDVFLRMAASGEAPEAIVQREGLRQLADPDAVGVVVARVVAAHPDAVADYRRGKKQSAAFLVGQVMKATAGKANPQLVQRLLTEQLG